MRLVMSDNPGQSELDSFLSGWDLEAAPVSQSILLAVFKRNHPELAFGSYSGPRLDGMLDFYKFKNLSMVASAAASASDRESRGRRYAIGGECAMRFHLPENPRTAESAVFENTFSLMRKGYLPAAGAMMRRSVTVSRFGATLKVISAEDLFYMKLRSLGKASRHGAFHSGLALLVYDMFQLATLTPDFDWNVVREDIDIMRDRRRSARALELFSLYCPDVVPESF